MYDSNKWHYFWIKNIFLTYVIGDSKHSLFYDSACFVANETYIKMFLIAPDWGWDFFW